MRAKSFQSCPTLCNPMGSPVHEILQARILEWVAISFSRGSSRPRDPTWVSCIASRFFTISATGKSPMRNNVWTKFCLWAADLELLDHLPSLPLNSVILWLSQNSGSQQQQYLLGLVKNANPPLPQTHTIRPSSLFSQVLYVLLLQVQVREVLPYSEK